MKRRLDWRAFPGMVISLIMIIFGILFFIVPIMNSGSFSAASLIFPLIWIGIILLAGIQTTLRFLGVRGVRPRDGEVLTNLYGPGSRRNYLDSVKSRYIKDGDFEQDTIDVEEALYQLELMKLDGAISDEEYQFVKADLMKKTR